MLIRHPHNLRTKFHGPTPSPPPTALQIVFGPQVDQITSTTARVSWGLNTYATGQVHYGTTAAYGSTTTAESSLTYSSHVQTITGLVAGTLYHYKVVGTDALDDTYDSGDFTFTTTGTVVSGYPTPAPLVYSATVATAAPAYLGKTTDGNHGTEIARVGQNDLDRNLYSTVSAWNCDGTRFAIYWGSTHAKLYDTTTSPWTLINASATTFASDMSWSDTDPASFYRHYGGNAIYRYTVSPTGTFAFAQSWTVGSHSDLLIGGWQGQMGGNYVPYTWDSHRGYGCLNIATGAYWEVDTGAASTIDATFVSQDGDHFVVIFNSDGTGATQGVWAMPSQGLTPKRRLSTTQDHADMGKLANGDQVFVMQSVGVNGQGYGTRVGMWNLDSADAYTQLLDYWPGGHVSCRNIARPGYAYMSNDMSYGTSNYAGRQDIFAVNLSDPPSASGDVEYYAKQHASDPRYQYYSDPMAVASPDGTMVAWSVRWDGAGSVYCYVAGVDTGM